MSQYTVTARNFAADSENRIHSDEMAKKFGFRGALVPGVAVYGHLTYPLVERFGEAWLSHSVDNVRLLKPTYDGEAVAVDMQETDGAFHIVSHSPLSELTAELTSQMPDQLPAPEDTMLLEGDYKHPESVEITWDNVEPMQPFAPWTFELSDAQNTRYTEQVNDPLPIYRDGVVHPHLLLSLANTALTNEYVMPTWIHVGSETRHRQLLKVGDTITIRSVPLEKWQKKGHEFIRLWVTYWRGDELTTDILHTAIFKVAS